MEFPAELRGAGNRVLCAIWRERYAGVWTIWGWDGGFKLPRHVRARRAYLARKRRTNAAPQMLKPARAGGPRSHGLADREMLEARTRVRNALLAAFDNVDSGVGGVSDG